MGCPQMGLSEEYEKEKKTTWETNTNVFNIYFRCFM